MYNSLVITETDDESEAPWYSVWLANKNKNKNKIICQGNQALEWAVQESDRVPTPGGI